MAAGRGGKGLGRKQARPKIRWADVFDTAYASLGTDGWQLLALCRSEWSNLEADFVTA